MCALPTILTSSTSQLGEGGLALPDTQGLAFVADLYQCSGITSSYTRSRSSRLGAIQRASWSYQFWGGCGNGQVEVEGGAPDLDTMAKDGWEIELLRDGTVWYRGRVMDYSQRTDEDTGRVFTTFILEGYATRLREILVTKDYSSTTVAAVAADILTTFVLPEARIKFVATDIYGPVIVNALSFKATPVSDALNTLAMLQGDIEWGITEGGPGSAFYFLAQSSSAKNEMEVDLPRNDRIGCEGDFSQSYNRIQVIGAWSSGTAVTATANDVPAQTLYGLREKTVCNSAINNATDADNLAKNWAALYSGGLSRLSGTIINPPARIEKTRIDPMMGVPSIPLGPSNVPITVTGVATFRGVDGVLTQEQFTSIDYEYAPGCPHRLLCHVLAGAPEPTSGLAIGRLTDELQSLRGLVLQYSAGIAAPHALLGAQHNDTTAAAAVRGDIIRGSATATWERYAVGTAGKVLRADGTDVLWSTSAFANTYGASELLYSTGANNVVGLATGNSGVLVTSEAGVPSIATDIPTAVTIGGAYIYRAAGTDIPVTDGGTGLSIGTSGGIPYYSAATTIASSALLAAGCVVLGGGAGVTPATLAVGSAGAVLYQGATAAWSAVTELFYDATNRMVGIGTSAPEAALDVRAKTAVGPAAACFYGYDSCGARTSAGVSTVWALSRGTQAAPAALTSVDKIAAGFNFKAYVGPNNTYQNVASFGFGIDGTVTDAVGGAPGRIIFYTQVGAGTFAEKMRLDKNGNLALNPTGVATSPIGTSGVGVLALATSTAPTTSPVDTVQLWAADVDGVAGHRGLHVLAEDGSTLKCGGGLGARAFSFSSPATNDDPEWIATQGRTVPTGNATTSNLVTIALGTNRSLLVVAHVIGRRYDGGGNVGDSAVYVLRGAYKDVASTVTALDANTPQQSFVSESDITCNATLVISGTSVIVQTTNPTTAPACGYWVWHATVFSQSLAY